MQPLQRERLYERLAAHISDFIDAQGLGPGDRLPSEREFAAELGVSRATISMALATLETRGIVEVRHGIGALVRAGGDAGAAISTGGGGGQAGPLADLGQRPRREVAVAREAILAGLARAAAADGRAILKSALLAPDGRPRTFEETWRCVRRLADAPLLAELDDALAAGAPAPAHDPAVAARLEQLASAILRGDPSGAAVACLGLMGDSPH